MESLVYCGLFMPLLGSLFLLFTSSLLGRRLTGLIGCSSIFISFLCFCSVLHYFVQSGMVAQDFTLFQWISIDKVHASFSLHIDSLSILMTLIITGVGFLIHVYSNGYMDHDESYVRYFSLMNFFVFSMLLLVLASHLLLLFVGWEGVGIASYLLIGFWYNRTSAARAATKAFVMNRIGDFGLLIGLLWTFYLFGTGDMQTVSQKASSMFQKGAPILTLVTLLYFVGSIGKSAQLPLHTWLPDAMEGPTPVSALIHAATMVTAGVYLIVRMHELFLLTPLTLQVVGLVGACTSLFAALCALGQTDLKKVLAYSTVSQLGLMFVACGAGAFYIAMFHLTTHAFMKSLLFLSAGNVVHMLNGTTAIEKMGGLSSKMKITNIFFLIGVLAMAGVPPLAAFFSKDMILENEYLTGLTFLFYISLAASIFTGVYLIRAYCLAFLGKSHLEKPQYDQIKEAPKIMTVPLIFLALLSVFGGFLGFSEGELPILAVFLKDIGINSLEQKLSSDFILSAETLLTIISVLIGVIVSAIVYTKYSDKIGANWKILNRSFYMDQIYEKLIAYPLKLLSKWIGYGVEPYIVDNSILVVAKETEGIAGKMQHLQSGQIRSYISWIVLGAVFALCYFILFTQNSG